MRGKRAKHLRRLSQVSDALDGITAEEIPVTVLEDGRRVRWPTTGAGRKDHRRTMRGEKHRINGQPDRYGNEQVMDVVRGENGRTLLVTRHGYDHFHTTKSRPWVRKARNRRRAVVAAASRRRNRVA